jgi:hypothetical protein
MQTGTIGSSSIIEKLFTSFTDLEKAIEGAKKTLESRSNTPPEIMTRLNSYDGILSKQRSLATQLCEEIMKGDWDAVSRYVSLINGLSAMIRDDARAILSAIVKNEPTTEPSEEKENFC